jgi:8-oxo-dGTP pyrophosphatase MutT (NUDIX family)
VHRKPLLELLDRYAARHPDEVACVARMRALVEARADCFERSCPPGHLTGSAFVLSADRRRVLLVHHRKLDRWLQPGGHADGESDVARVALREAREETGLASLTFVGPDGAAGRAAPGPLDHQTGRAAPGPLDHQTGRAAPGPLEHQDPLPFDLDVHEIPARPGEPLHEHHDVRFLLVAAGGEDARASEESHAVRWFPLATLEEELDVDESVLRMARKARAIVAAADAR